MLNKYLFERLEGIRKTLVAQGSAGQLLPSASKGDEREIFIREFLSKVFPSHFRFGTGTITDSKECLSGQVDIVIELPFFPSFPVPPGDVRLYIAEGVVAVIEIKSDLSSQWDQVEETTKKIRPLPRDYESSSFMSFGGGASPRIPIYAVGYKGYKSAEPLMRRMKDTEASARPDGVLVLDPGIFIGPDVMNGGTIIARDAPALYALIATINAILNSLQVNGFDFEKYI